VANEAEVASLLPEVCVSITGTCAVYSALPEVSVALPGVAYLYSVAAEISAHIPDGLAEVTSALPEVSIALAGAAQLASVAVEISLSFPGAAPDQLAVTAAVLEVLCGHLPVPEDVSVANYSDIAERRFGRDLVLPGPGQTVQPTPTGDWPSVGGRENLHAAVRRRMLTTPGQLVHRPEYGAGLETYVGRRTTSAELARLAAQGRQNLLRDPRIEESRVGVQADGSRVQVEVAIKPTGEGETDTVTIVSGG
jgi:phage baseplate assembly protein W